jgi:hypothetical protein
VHKISRSWVKVLSTSWACPEAISRGNVNACEQLRQITSDDVTFWSRVVIGDESGTYGYGAESKHQSPQQESSTTP